MPVSCRGMEIWITRRKDKLSCLYYGMYHSDHQHLITVFHSWISPLLEYILKAKSSECPFQIKHQKKAFLWEDPLSFPPSSGCWDLLEKLAWFWRRVGKKPSGDEAGEKTSHGEAITRGEGDLSLSIAIFRQHFERYEENYPMVLWISFGSSFPGHKYLSMG